MAKLTEKQKRFVSEYLVDLNATQAGIRAGYSPRTAAGIAAENLRKPQIQQEIQKRMAQREERTQITQDRVLQELASIGFYDIAEFAKIETSDIAGLTLTSVTLTETSKLIPAQRAAIAGIKNGANGIEVKMQDKLRALEMIMRHLGMWDKNQKGLGDEREDDNLFAAIRKAVEAREV